MLIKQIFGGQADQILSNIRNVFTNDITKQAIKQDITIFPHLKIQDKLKGTTKDMSVDDEFIDNMLKNQKDDSLSFSILALLYPNLDYKNGNFHKDHLHPASYFRPKSLQERGISSDKFSTYTDSQNWNSILNLQLLEMNENASKQDVSLSEWIKAESKKQKISIEKFCENHLIPPILDFSMFPEFINKRRILLKDKLKQIIN